MRFSSIAGLVGLALALCHCGSNRDSEVMAPDGSVSPRGDAATSKHDANDARSSAVDASAADGVAVVHDASNDGAAPVDAGVDAPVVPCGERTGMRGLTSRSIMVGTKLRTYLIYLPSTLDPLKPIPFVFVFHGFTMSGHDMYDITQYAALADAEGIGVAFPDGEGGPESIAAPWNIENPGQAVCGDGQFAVADGDDFGFIDAMKADVAEDQCLDTKHVFSTGFSMGGYFTHHIGCLRTDMRAIAPHSGGMLASLASCNPGHIPVIIFHGTADSVIDDSCDDPHVTPDPNFPASATLWAAKNGCQATYSTVPTNGDAGGTGQCYVYDGCPADGQVELCTFNGMDHCWAGGDPDGGTGSACPAYASATHLEWAFFKQYAW
jgi:polyhydroxybutyrate depolymerase